MHQAHLVQNKSQTIYCLLFYIMSVTVKFEHIHVCGPCLHTQDVPNRRTVGYFIINSESDPFIT